MTVVAVVAALAAAVFASGSYASIILVSPGQSIQHAIDVAKSGDTVLVSAGVYRENLTIAKGGILLRGGGMGKTVLMPGSAPTPSPCSDDEEVQGICVIGDGAPVDRTTVDRLSVQGFSGFGVGLFNASNPTVSNVEARDNGGYGISGFVLSNVRFAFNSAHDNGEPGFYIGDSPHANAVVTGNVSTHNGVGGPEGLGFLFRDSSHGFVMGNKAFDNCAGFVFVDSPENPDPAADWHAFQNEASHNNGACIGEEGGAPPLSGLGFLLFGTQSTTLTQNRADDNVPTGFSVASGGIVLASSESIGGAVENANSIVGNTAHGNVPFDLLWDGEGVGNVFSGNFCDSSLPGGLCN